MSRQLLLHQIQLPSLTFLSWNLLVPCSPAIYDKETTETSCDTFITVHSAHCTDTFGDHLIPGRQHKTQVTLSCVWETFYWQLNYTLKNMFVR